MKTSCLEIRLLGPVEILFDREPLKIPRRVERGILYYLAVMNQPVSREKLIDFLWPQAEQIDPRGTLRTALSRLRRALPDPSLLVAELDQVGLDFSRCSVDLTQFEESYQSLQGILSALPQNQVMPVQIVNQITESLAMWHGDRIIQGDDLTDYPELDAWCQTLNNDLGLHRVFLIKRLAEHYQASGKLEMAMDLFIQLGRLNHLDIPSHLSVIDILIKLGRHQESLEFCDSLEVYFERELSAPLPDEIMERCQHAQMLLYTTGRKSGLGWPVSTSIQLPLVGRSTELSQLRDAFYRGGLVLLTGEMGAGKTRLVQELYEILSPKPMLIIAPARESENTLPFAPIVHGLRRHVPEEVLMAVDTVWANQLTLLLPELTQIREDCDPSKGKPIPASRQHLFDALHHLLLSVAGTYGRIFFLLDDAHWADQQTLQALSYLITQGFFSEHGVLIMTVHSEYPNRGIDEIVNQFHHAYPIQMIHLPGLNPDEVRSLIQQVLSQPLSPAFYEQLYRETNGNPLMVLETIRHVLEMSTNIEDLQSMDRFPLPESIQALIRNRLNRLGKDARYILTCAALIGNDISVNLLQGVSDIRQRTFLRALDTLFEGGFLQANTIQQSNQEHLSFTHEKMREVVILEAPATHRQIIHQRVAMLLSHEPHASDQAAVIAEHYQSGGDLPNGFTWLLIAAGHAWSLGAREDVNRSFQQAERMVNHSPEGLFSLNDILQLYQQWNDFAYQSNQVDLLEALGVKLQQLAKQEPGDQLMGLSRMALANACFLREDYETGMILIDESVKNLKGNRHPEMLIQALYYQASFCWWTLDFEGVFTAADQISKILDNPVLEIPNRTSCEFAVKFLLADTYYAQGEANRALEIAEDAYRTYFDQLGTFDRLRAYHMLTYCFYIAGQVEKCVHFAWEALKIAQSLDNSVVETLSLINLCKAEIEQGQIDSAFQHAARALELAETNNKIQNIVAANTIIGTIYDILHNYTQAEQYFRIAQIRQGYTFLSYSGQENNLHLGRLLTRNGQLAEAKEIVRSTLEVTGQKGMHLLYTQALLADGLLDINEQNDADAEQKFALAIKIAQEKGLAQEVTWGKFRMALLAFSRQQYAEAETFVFEVIIDAIALKMTLLTKYALELADRLANFITLQVGPDELGSIKQSLVEQLMSYNQTEPLRRDFFSRQHLWREKA
jgi:DNA-binding SARP family transcriptional activator/tetratricopeptide (TPR) repeat protein/energy-coupling factor transporter ATP-binding protein EcfA2